MGDAYVDMTENNIESGNPFGVYQTGHPFIVWIGIMINNTIAALTDYAKGISLGILSVISIMRFGIEVGSFDYMFYSKGLWKFVYYNSNDTWYFGNFCFHSCHLLGYRDGKRPLISRHDQPPRCV